MDGSDGGSIAEESQSDFEYDVQSDDDIPMAAPVDNKEGEAQDEDAMIIEPPEVRRAPYITMTRADIADRQSRCIEITCDLLSVPKEECFVLLREHGWDVSKLQEAWFDNEAQVRRKCGLIYEQGSAGSASSSSTAAASGSKVCGICMETVDERVFLECAHGFCAECWAKFLNTAVDDGKAAVQTRCPTYKCGRVVPVDFFKKYCDETRQKKYDEWYIRSYVDDNQNVKWCPNPAGCTFVCEYQGSDPLEIRCVCGFHSCWACAEEAHRPADCATVSKWNIKNSAESENISWIRANTKKCPKCHRAIEKNQGCNHMVCSKAGGCGHEFCWLCLGEWSTHGTATGGYYQCNIYDRQAKEGKHAEEEKTRMKAKHALDKYMFYFERFMDHDRGMKLTTKEEQDVEVKVQMLHDKHSFEIIELEFLYAALRQVRACRRVLKWSYVYGYYLEEVFTGQNFHPEQIVSAKNLFEHLQKNLEEKTDNLHEMLEKDFETIFQSEDAASGDAEAAKNRFMEFRSHVTNFTNVTQKFLTQILDALCNVNGGSLTYEDGAMAPVPRRDGPPGR